MFLAYLESTFLLFEKKLGGHLPPYSPSKISPLEMKIFLLYFYNLKNNIGYI